MRAIFSLSAVILAAACGTTTDTRDGFMASAIKHEARSGLSYDQVYACLLDQVPLGATTPMGTTGRAVLFPEQRRAELAKSAPSVWGDTTWFWLIGIDADESDGSVVRAFHNREMDARAHMRMIQACT